jgi:tetratricopeptide (TPR) repeat protein
MTEARRTTAGIGLAVALALAACANQERPEPERTQVDQQLLAALGMAQSYQHQADELEVMGDREAALTKVRLVLEIPFPEGTPEREDLRLDAWGRLAELHLAGDALDDAETAIGQGLAEASRASYFQARLFAIRGRVFRTRAASLREAGNEEASREMSRRAIETFEQSIAINRQVLGLADAGAEQGE